jgi:hypothetical protein
VLLNLEPAIGPGLEKETLLVQLLLRPSLKVTICPEAVLRGLSTWFWRGEMLVSGRDGKAYSSCNFKSLTLILLGPSLSVKFRVSVRLFIFV